MLSLLSLLTTTTFVVELFLDQPTEFPGNNISSIHPSVGISLADYQPLLPASTSIDDFESHSIKNHVGERVTTMLSKIRQETSPLFKVRREVLIIGNIENWLIECVQEEDADIRGYTRQDVKRNLATKGCCGDVVKDVAHILEDE